MILLDTDVMIDISRGYVPALEWLKSVDESKIDLPGIVALELIQGCRNRQEQDRVESMLSNYVLYWATLSDCIRAYETYKKYHLSHQISIMDTLIGETAVGLNVPLATFNKKHYQIIANLQMIQPYERP